MKSIERNYSMRKLIILYVFSIVWLVLTGVADYLTGNEISLSMFYLLVIIAVNWYHTFRYGLIVCCLCIAVIAFTDIIADDDILSPYIYLWNLSATALIYFIMAYLVSRLRSTLVLAQKFSSTDHLTGLPNLRHFIAEAEKETVRARRYSHPVTVIFVDCDNFKQVNDSLGHAEGDRLLRTVGDVLSAHTRETDIVGRIGGDEFCILMAETAMDAAMKHIEFLKDMLLVAVQAEQWPVTFSFGVASFISMPHSAEEMIKSADKLMYQGKKEGKNRIIRFQYE